VRNTKKILRNFLRRFAAAHSECQFFIFFIHYIFATPPHPWGVSCCKITDLQGISWWGHWGCRWGHSLRTSGETKKSRRSRRGRPKSIYVGCELAPASS
jgi:hypothetical protein